MSYRDDHEARLARVAEIERQLTDLRRRKTEWQALDSAIAELERDLALQRSVLHRQTLPVLDNLRVASPCDMNWDGMQGDARARFCGKCDKHVYNLSNMTRAEGEALIHEKEGKLCVRFYQRADGTVLTTDCPVGARKLRFRRAITAGAGASILMTGAMWLTAMTRMGAPVRHLDPPKPPTPPTVTTLFQGGPAVPKMGKPCMPVVGGLMPVPAPTKPVKHKPKAEVMEPITVDPVSLKMGEVEYAK